MASLNISSYNYGYFSCKMEKIFPDAKLAVSLGRRLSTPCSSYALHYFPLTLSMMQYGKKLE